MLLYSSNFLVWVWGGTQMSWIRFGVDVFVRHIWVKLQANGQKQAKKCFSWKLVQNWRDIWRKSVRYFRTQLIVSGFYNVSILALCWRKCGMTGDRSHIFWDCPVLQGFWQKNWTNNENCLPSVSSIVCTWAAPQNVTLKDQNIRCTQMLIRGHFSTKMDSTCAVSESLNGGKRTDVLEESDPSI